MSKGKLIALNVAAIAFFAAMMEVRYQVDSVWLRALAAGVGFIPFGLVLSLNTRFARKAQQTAA